MKSLPAFLLIALAASCGGKSAPDPTLPQAGAVEVSIAAVTLADDCGSGPTGAPVEAAAEHSMQEPAAGASMKRMASMSQSGDRACEQSAIQLRVANGSAAASKVALHKVEVLDESGTVIGELTPREPSRWAEDSYQPWDEQVATGETLQVSYALSSQPLMRGATYTVRITVGAGDDERTLEQKTTLQAEASLPPDAVT